MPLKRKAPVEGVGRKKSKFLVADVVAQDVMPPCSSCSNSNGKKKCRLVAGECVCTECALVGKKCDLYLTVEDGTSLLFLVLFLFC